MVTLHKWSVCEDDLKDKYFSGKEIRLFFSMIVLLPIIIMLILAVIIRSTHRYVHTELTKSSIHHPMFAGLTLTGVHILLFILCLDAAAFYFYRKNMHEYSNDGVKENFNLFVVFITIIMDVVVALQFLFCMLYLCCSQMYKECKCCKCCCECCLPFFIAPYFYVIFGQRIRKWRLPKLNSEQGAQYDPKNAENKLNLWVLTGTMVAPVFCVASHAGYILIAWVTEPAKTTAAFLVALGSFLYLFVVFRQCYIVHKDADQEEWRQEEEQQARGEEEQQPLREEEERQEEQQQQARGEEEEQPLREEERQVKSCGRFLISCCSKLISFCLELNSYFSEINLYCCKKHWMVWFFPIVTIPLFSLYTLCIWCINSLYTCVHLCCPTCKKSNDKTTVSCCPICKKPTDDETLENYWESMEVTDDAIVKTNENTFNIKGFCTACRMFSLFHFFLLCSPSANNPISPVP